MSDSALPKLEQLIEKLISKFNSLGGENIGRVLKQIHSPYWIFVKCKNNYTKVRPLYGHMHQSTRPKLGILLNYIYVFFKRVF